MGNSLIEFHKYVSQLQLLCIYWFFFFFFSLYGVMFSKLLNGQNIIILMDIN